MKVDVLLGLQWGDEGKGKVVDVLTPKYDIIARFQGGPNAGHTIIFDKKNFVLHTIPSGIFNKDTQNVIGNGVIVDPCILKKEIDTLAESNINTFDNLYISKKAHLILPSHRLLDATYEKEKGKSKIGSTLKGIGPTYSDKTARTGIRFGDVISDNFIEKYNKLKSDHFKIIDFYKFDFRNYKIDGFTFDEYEKNWLKAVSELKEFKLIDSEYFINDALKQGKSVLAEGAQGTMLDLDFGSYPFVTSSNTITSGVCSGLGVAPKNIGKVIGIFKAYCTRVGSGPFPTELHDADGDKLREIGREFGSTTGRPRRCGWLDLNALKYSIMLNGVDELMMMKADVMSPFEKIKISSKYNFNGKLIDKIPFDISVDGITPIYNEFDGWNIDIENLTSIDDVPEKLMDYVKYIEKEVDVPIKIISVGPDRKQTIIRD